MADIKKLLQSVWAQANCGQLVQGQKLISIPADASVEDACEILSRHKILSAPIWNEAQQAYVGLFDTGDMTAFLLTVFKKAGAPKGKRMDLRTIVREGIKSLPVPVKWVADLSLRNPVRLVRHDDNLGAAVAIFAQGVHRVCVTDDKGHIIGILSQSAVSRWLEEKHFATVAPIASRTLQDLDMVSKHVVSVDASESLLTALEAMHKNGVSSVAMLNSDRQLIGSVSLSDAKYIFSNLEFEWLWRPCHEFISAVRSDQALLDHGGKDAAPVFGVRPTATLEFAMKKMRATKAHRVWVVPGTGQSVVGVVSLTDVMRVLNPAAA